MHDPSNDLEDRVGQLDDAVGRLTSEVASLKLELATLVSALRERQLPQDTPPNRVSRVLPAPVGPRPKVDPPSRPSPAPAAIVVLLAVSLLAWQLVAGPRPAPGRDTQGTPSVTPQPAAAPPLQAAPIESPPTEPPLTPLVTPTIYKGTLAVTAAQPGARVFVNRKDVGTVPVRVRNLKAGAHLVWIESEGYRRWTRVVTVPAERVTRVSATLEPLEPPIQP